MSQFPKEGRGDLPPPPSVAYLIIGINICNLWISDKIFVIFFIFINFVSNDFLNKWFDIWSLPLSQLSEIWFTHFRKKFYRFQFICTPPKITIFSRIFMPPHFSVTSALFYVKDSIVKKSLVYTSVYKFLILLSYSLFLFYIKSLAGKQKIFNFLEESTRAKNKLLDSLGEQRAQSWNRAI